MKRKFIKIVSLLVFSSLLLSGCGSSSSTSYVASEAAMVTDSFSNGAVISGAMFSSTKASRGVSYDDYEMEEAYFDEDIYMDDVEVKEVSIENETPEYAKSETRKLIKTVHLDIQTKNFDNLTNNIEGLVDDNSGYIESANIDGQGYWGNTHRYASYTIRVPKDKINNIVNSLGDLGVISSKSENIEDVTLSYYDQDSQKKALEVEQERLMEILESAETMDQIIALESRLSDVRYQINSLGTNLKLLDNKVDYSTIYLNVQEVDVEVAPKNEEKTVFEEIAENWEQNIIDIKFFFEDLIISMTSNIGTIIFEIIVVIAIIMIVKTKKKNKKRKLEIKKKEEEANK